MDEDIFRKNLEREIGVLARRYNESIKLYGPEEHIRGVEFNKSDRFDYEFFVSLITQQSEMLALMKFYNKNFGELPDFLKKLEEAFDKRRNNYVKNLVDNLDAARKGLESK
jgi:hypothetical protein